MRLTDKERIQLRKAHRNSSVCFRKKYLFVASCAKIDHINERNCRRCFFYNITDKDCNVWVYRKECPCIRSNGSVNFIAMDDAINE